MTAADEDRQEPRTAGSLSHADLGRELLRALDAPVEGHERGPLVAGAMTESGWLHAECECGEYAWPCPHALREQNDRVRTLVADTPVHVHDEEAGR